MTLEACKCSCGKTIGDLYLLFVDLKKKNSSISNFELFKKFNITKECCKLKFITGCLYSDYMLIYN
jgi:DNA-directed RNA polymerase subunit N (RpoN/RPB10)